MPDSPLTIPELIAENQEITEQILTDQLAEEAREEAETTANTPPAESAAETIPDPNQKYLDRARARRETEAKAREAARKRAALALKIVSPPVITKRITPQYPESLCRAQQQGRVVVSVTVTAESRASNARVSSSSGQSAFDNAALAAARKFRFRPARNALNQAVPAPKDLPFTFLLK